MEDFQTITRPLIGRKAWNAKRGYGSFLTVEFGKSISKTRKATTHLPEQTLVSGEWSLWLYRCEWRIERHDEIIASSRSELNETIDAAARTLNGLELKSIKLEERTWDTRFIFSDNHAIQTFSTDLDEDYWKLRTPARRHFAVGPNKGWRLEE